MSLLRPALSLIFLLASLLGSPAPAESSPLVDLKKYDFSIRMDIRYATPDNFLKRKLYSEPLCFLRRPVVEALSRVQASLKVVGLGLQVFDCYRPLSVQRLMWPREGKGVPDPRSVPGAEKGTKEGSRHNRGTAVDLTLVDHTGTPLPMPSAYDDFTKRAHRDFKGGDPKALENRDRLAKAMAKEGFVPLPTDWWHFDYRDWQKFPVEDIPFSRLK